MNPVRRAIEKMDELIALTKRKIELLEEMKRAFLIAEKAGVNPRDIAKVGYDHSRDKRWSKWPFQMKQTIQPEHNYVILNDGTKVEWEIDWETPLKDWREKQKQRKAEHRTRHGY